MPKFYSQRIDVTDVTPRTAPAYGSITHAERNGRSVLAGKNGLLLIGPLGVNFYVEGADRDVVYLRRWDVPSLRDNDLAAKADPVRDSPFTRT